MTRKTLQDTVNLVSSFDLGIYNTAFFSNQNNNKNKSLKIFYHNCSGMRSKVDLLFLMSLFSIYNVIVLVETWLNKTFFDAELMCDDWVIYRTDRDYDGLGLTRGGGVLIAIHKSIASSNVNIVFDKSLEQTWAKIVTESCSLYLGAI